MAVLCFILTDITTDFGIGVLVILRMHCHASREIDP